MSSEKKKFDIRNLLVRTLAGAVCLGLFIFSGILGGWYFFGFTALLTFLGVWEFYGCTGVRNTPFGIIGLVAAIGELLITALGFTYLRLPLLVMTFLLQMIFYVLGYEKTDAKRAMAAFFGLFYAAILFSCLYDMRTMADGKHFVFLTIISAWGSDTFAYLSGSMFGKHKLAPLLSPKKSIEGVAGGFVGAAVLGLIFALAFREGFTEIQKPVTACMVMCAAGSVFSVFGDLTASAFKRDNGVKDYSHLIPGHGGVLDRFDSILFVAPVIYYLAKVFTLG